MREDINKYILDMEEKTLYLETKLKNILKTTKYINEGNYDKTKKSLNSYKKSSEYLIMKELFDRFESLQAPPVAVDDKSYRFLKIILDNIPFPVFIKDEDAKYLLINKYEEDLFGIKEDKILGKHDSDFVMDEEEMKIIKESDEAVLLENKHIELPNQNFTLKRGKSFVFKTHKIPFINPITGKRNILGYSVDITDTVNLDKLKKILLMNSPYL